MLMVLAMVLWVVVLKCCNALEFKRTLKGWMFISGVTALFLIFKSLTSPIIRPTNEVAIKVTKPVIVEVVQPVELKDFTLLAKPKEVTKAPTPLFNKALEHAQQK